MGLHKDVGKGMSKVGGGGVAWDLVEADQAADVGQRQREGLSASRGVQKRGLNERLAQARSNKVMRAEIKARSRAQKRGGTYVRSLKNSG